MKTALAASALVLLMLPGCVSLSRSKTVQAMPQDLRAGGQVTDVRLIAGPDDVSPEFEAVFERRVQARMRKCSDSGRPLRLEARISKVDKANPLLAVALADKNKVRGEAALVDPATGRTLGRYRIGKTIVGSRFGYIRMAEAEEQLADAFGDELCAKAFPAAQNSSR